MRSHPYANAPEYARWRKAVGTVPPDEIDPVVRMPFSVKPTDKVATAGSCFAQHIARYLSTSGFTYFVTEPGHPLLTPETRRNYNYGTFSARFGNIYTSRQLLQLVQRAYGGFCPRDVMWEEDGKIIDPYRPTIQPDGFSSAAEFMADREQHFAAVRQMFEEADVFVFTMGLTEGWINAVDGAAYPICPGVSGGLFDPAEHLFHNETVDEVISNMQWVVDWLRRVNPLVRVILTVSPVPLAATAMDRHVLVSTTYSKSVLRVAGEALTELPNVAYFPSYEIIAGNFNRGRYYAENLRDVVEDGVRHVMRLFFRHAAPDFGSETIAATNLADPDAGAAFIGKAASYVEVICDEAALDAPAC